MLRTSDFTQAGRVGPGVATFSSDAQSIYVAEDGGNLHVYDATTFVKTRIIETDCAVQSPDRLLELPGRQAWALMGDDVLCVIPLAGAAPATKSGGRLATTDRSLLLRQRLHDAPIRVADDARSRPARSTLSDAPAFSPASIQFAGNRAIRS